MSSCPFPPRILAHASDSPEKGLQILGKFLSVGNEKFYCKGVTYGPFSEGRLNRRVVARDLIRMSAHGVNAIRTFAVPPIWLLDMAAKHGVRVMVGVAWEQHIHFLDEPERVLSIVSSVRDAVERMNGHPAVLCCTVGNEIPAAIVRWYGSRRIERFLRRLYMEAKEADPKRIISYVNYPPTEYLHLPFLDLVAFNVYLEDPRRLQAYLARLQNLAGERPLILSEVGLDSRSRGRKVQAQVLEEEIRIAFQGGCAGAFVFSWTDEWFRGGVEIEDWEFGLTDKQRNPKPSLGAVSRAFAQVPAILDGVRPRVSVVVCVRNGAQTIDRCLSTLERLNYPDYEVIVVDDGSSDETASLARKYDVRLISTQNRGLSSARNTGLHASNGEIVAYLDADAYPDPDWLAFLVQSLKDPRFVGVGGPNLAPPDCGLIARCVSHAPGGPQHILLSDQIAEHIPGCNMSFRRDALLEVGGFDSRFRIAGDDVDICWRLQQAGGKLAFSPGAVVWHYPRSSIGGYWQQQLNYGRAEAMLANKWPENFNRFGHLAWRGRLYGNGPILLARGTSRIYHGVWGTGFFQSAEDASPSPFSAFLHMPECWLAFLVLVGASLSGLLWIPLFHFFLGLFSFFLGILLIQASSSAHQVTESDPHQSTAESAKRECLTAWLYLVQPVARLAGRLSYQLARGKGERVSSFRIPRSYYLSHWSEVPKTKLEWLGTLESQLRRLPVLTLRGGPYDRWDLEVWAGLFGGVRLLGSLEEHGGGRQMFRLAIWPRFSRTGLGLTLGLTILLVAAGLGGAWAAPLFLICIVLSLCFRSLQESGGASGSVSRVIEKWQLQQESRPEREPSFIAKGNPQLVRGRAR